MNPVSLNNQPLTPLQLRYCRLDLGYTQAELAALLDVTVTAYARWERGEETPAHPKMLRLALERLLLGGKKTAQTTNEFDDGMDVLEAMLAASEKLTENRRQRIRRMPEVRVALELVTRKSSR